MKTLLLLSTLFFINCVQSPGASEPELIEKISKYNPEYFSDYSTINIDTLNLWEYEIWVAIFDHQGGGYKEGNTYNYRDIQRDCVTMSLPALTFDIQCIKDYFIDYAHLLEIQVITRYINQ